MLKHHGGPSITTDDLAREICTTRVQMILVVVALIEVTVHLHSACIAGDDAMVLPASLAIGESWQRRENKTRPRKERMHHVPTRRLAFFMEAERARPTLARMVGPKTFFFAPEAAIHSSVILLLKLMTRHAFVNQKVIILAHHELVCRPVTRFKKPLKIYINRLKISQI